MCAWLPGCMRRRSRGRCATVFVAGLQLLRRAGAAGHDAVPPRMKPRHGSAVHVWRRSCRRATRRRSMLTARARQRGREGMERRLAGRHGEATRGHGGARGGGAPTTLRSCHGKGVRRRRISGRSGTARWAAGPTDAGGVWSRQRACTCTCGMKEGLEKAQRARCGHDATHWSSLFLEHCRGGRGD